MHFIPLLLFAAGAAAFTIPTGQPDGVYEVYTAADGTETHTLLQAPNEPVGARSAVDGKFGLAHKRGITYSVKCGGYILPSADTDYVNAALDNQCAGGAVVGGGRDFYSIRGCVVAYFCNYTSGTQFCYASERQATSSSITSACGLYGAGWEEINDNSSRDVQYGYENNCNQGWNFCGRGTDGKR